MKNRYNIYILILFLFQLSLPGYGQDDIMHTQGIMKQEFMNPAYNSFKDYTSINLLTRQQWYNRMDGTPKIYAANVYLPVSLSGLGIGLTVIEESIGLREKVSFSGSLSHNIRVGASNYLAFGYGIGVQNISYDMNRLKTYTNLSIGGLDLNSTNLNAQLGIFYYGPMYFAGLSSNLLFNKNNFDSGSLLPGFDFTSGFVYQISDDVIFRPDMVLKYYQADFYESGNGQITKSTADPVFDLGLNFLLAGKLWVGTSHRFGQAQTFSADVFVRDAFKVGYTFELGIGKGMNQFNSHGVRLVWDIKTERALQGFDRTGRHNIKGLMRTYMY